ncbi:MAG TPA: Crp/Fnr family transcriptional regulator [Micropepsaceae bacterium]|jgi:CRP-like cAMP-binding protein|nr:Crp/Fnr family transcriptional regulator [Micropepsaceae bacterium]
MSYRNQLLTVLARGGVSLDDHLERVEFAPHERVQNPNQPVDFVYFPESGQFSLMAAGLLGRNVEVGIIGNEGMTGVCVALGDDRSPHLCFAQVRSVAFRLAATVLTDANANSTIARAILTKYAHTVMTQMAYSALAGAHASIEQRLARWLLMSQDRLGSPLPVTHEQLAFSIGVRRAGITEALHQLAGKKCITVKRRRIEICDRIGLQTLAAGLYGTPEREYQRLTLPA